MEALAPSARAMDSGGMGPAIPILFLRGDIYNGFAPEEMSAW